ncbi:MAG: DUF2905 domain-containing protein [Pseudomonadota bacterium]
MTRILVTLGIILVITRVAWPWFAKPGLGRLPGDIVIERAMRDCRIRIVLVGD